MKEIKQEPKTFDRVDSKESIFTASSRTSLYRKYNKITNNLKSQFLQLIINGNCSIKKAAQMLNINYSSAKSIISGFRKQSQKNFKVSHSSNLKTSMFKQAFNHTKSSKMMLSTSIGSAFVSQKLMYIDFSSSKGNPTFESTPTSQYF